MGTSGPFSGSQKSSEPPTRSSRTIRNGLSSRQQPSIETTLGWRSRFIRIWTGNGRQQLQQHGRKHRWWIQQHGQQSNEQSGQPQLPVILICSIPSLTADFIMRKLKINHRSSLSTACSHNHVPHYIKAYVDIFSSLMLWNLLQTFLCSFFSLRK